MRCALCTVVVWQLLAAPAQPAFETIQALSLPVAFDPIRPALHYWHALPQRLVDGQPRVQLTAAQPYGLVALRTATAEVTVQPGRRVGLGFSCTSMGSHDTYGEVLLTVGGATDIRNRLALGVNASYGRVGFGNHFTALHQLTFGAGVRVTFTRQFSLDLAASRLPLTQSERRLSTAALSAGATWQHSHELALRAAMGSGSQWSLGETLRLGSNLALAANLLASPLRLQVGALLSAGSLGFDFLYKDDPELGGDLAVGILFWL